MTADEYAGRNNRVVSEQAFWLVMALALIFCPAHSAQAATKTWVAGGATGDWGIASNWNSNSLPALADDVLFDNSGQSPLEDIFLSAPRTINSGTTSGTAAILKRTGTASEGSGAHTTNGGVTSTGTNATGLGALTLNSNSTLDYGTGGVGTLVFASFTPNGHVLNITNYTTTASAPLTSGTDGTDDRLIFNQDQLTNLTDFSTLFPQLVAP